MARSAKSALIIAFVSAAVAGAALAKLNPQTAPETDLTTNGFVTVDIGGEHDLYVARRAVTAGEWSECVDDGGCQARAHQRDPDAPVTLVSWFDAQQYIAWRSEHDRITYRLPTHAEWVLAAAEQAPAPAEKLFDAPELAWAAHYSMEPRPTPNSDAAEHKNSFGIAGLRDSVWEWTNSCQETADNAPENCASARIAMGDHLSLLSEFVSDPSKAGCGAGNPIPAVGFRLVSDGLSIASH